MFIARNLPDGSTVYRSRTRGTAYRLIPVQPGWNAYHVESNGQRWSQLYQRGTALAIIDRAERQAS